jgi:hypothetical protein
MDFSKYIIVIFQVILAITSPLFLQLVRSFAPYESEKLYYADSAISRTSVLDQLDFSTVFTADSSAASTADSSAVSTAVHKRRKRRRVSKTPLKKLVPEFVPKPVPELVQEQVVELVQELVSKIASNPVSKPSQIPVSIPNVPFVINETPREAFCPPFSKAVRKYLYYISHCVSKRNTFSPDKDQELIQECMDAYKTDSNYGQIYYHVHLGIVLDNMIAQFVDYSIEHNLANKQAILIVTKEFRNFILN